MKYPRKVYCIRQYEKKGKELAKSGITMEILEKLARGEEDFE